MSEKLTKERHHDEMVIFCPVCGHSYGAVKLAAGDDNCGGTVCVIALDAWREIAQQSDFRLTDAGRAALEKTP